MAEHAQQNMVMQSQPSNENKRSMNDDNSGGIGCDASKSSSNATVNGEVPATAASPRQPAGTSHAQGDTQLKMLEKQIQQVTVEMSQATAAGEYLLVGQLAAKIAQLSAKRIELQRRCMSTKPAPKSLPPAPVKSKPPPRVVVEVQVPDGCGEGAVLEISTQGWY